MKTVARVSGEGQEFPGSKRSRVQDESRGVREDGGSGDQSEVVVVQIGERPGSEVVNPSGDQTQREQERREGCFQRERVEQLADGMTLGLRGFLVPLILYFCTLPSLSLSPVTQSPGRNLQHAKQ